MDRIELQQDEEERMAELADAPDLGSGGETREGSIPSSLKQGPGGGTVDTVDSKSTASA